MRFNGSRRNPKDAVPSRKISASTSISNSCPSFVVNAARYRPPLRGISPPRACSGPHPPRRPPSGPARRTPHRWKCPEPRLHPRAVLHLARRALAGRQGCGGRVSVWIRPCSRCPRGFPFLLQPSIGDRSSASTRKLSAMTSCRYATKASSCLIRTDPSAIALLRSFSNGLLSTRNASVAFWASTGSLPPMAPRTILRIPRYPGKALRKASPSFMFLGM